MYIRERAVGTITVFEPHGELVLTETEGDTALRDRISALLREGRKYFVFDLTHASHVDTTGLTVLVGAYIAVRKRGGRLILANPTSRMRSLLAVTKLNTLLEVFDSEREALVTFGTEAGA